jgi:hypothetical protein
VQHDPRRADLLPRLLDGIDHPDVQVISDPDPGSSIRSPWRCFLACLESAGSSCTHLLTVQDDAIVCRDFAATVHRVIDARPDDAVALFVPGVGLLQRTVLAGCAADERFVELPAREFVPVVAVVMPAGFVDDLRAWAVTARLSPVMRSDDANVGSFVRAAGRRVLATVPSLVDHPDDVRSLVNAPNFAGLNPQRVAACWAGRDWSPLELDWR